MKSSCGCNHKSHKIDVVIPTDPSKVRNKKIFPEKNNPFMGDIS